VSSPTAPSSLVASFGPPYQKQLLKHAKKRGVE